MQPNFFVLGNVLRVLPVSTNKTVQGASTSALPKDFSAIQKELSKLPLSEIATSSPQIQKIIHDLQTLPREQAKIICQNLCGNIK